MATPNKRTKQIVQAPAETLAAEAIATIRGPRESDYGNKLANFTQIALLWNGYLARKLLPTGQLTATDVAQLMVLMKVARLAHKPEHHDSRVDVIGYMLCDQDLRAQLNAPEEKMLDPVSLLDALIYDNNL